ncbi:MAG: PilZ domain-containing protein [Planctomycetota bacterium]
MDEGARSDRCKKCGGRCKSQRGHAATGLHLAGDVELKLNPRPVAGSDESNDGPYRLERRRSQRSQFAGNATVMCWAGDDDRRLASVNLVNRSFSGIGLVAPLELPVGTTIELVGSPELSDTVGTVVRCRMSDNVWHVGVSFSHRAAA